MGAHTGRACLHASAAARMFKPLISQPLASSLLPSGTRRCMSCARSHASKKASKEQAIQAGTMRTSVSNACVHLLARLLRTRPPLRPGEHTAAPPRTLLQLAQAHEAQRRHALPLHLRLLRHDLRGPGLKVDGQALHQLPISRRHLLHHGLRPLQVHLHHHLAPQARPRCRCPRC